MIPDADILTVAQVAEWLRCSRQHVINMADGRTEPKLPAFKLGNRWRFRREAVETFIREAEAA